jgi:hypothetical protein
MRRIGVGIGLALGLVCAGAAALFHSDLFAKLAGGVLFVTCFTTIRGLWAERQEKRAGLPVATSK